MADQEVTQFVDGNDQDMKARSTNPSPPISSASGGVDAEDEPIGPEEKMLKHITGRSKRKPREKAIPFPVKLMYALDCGEYDDIISWAGDGSYFKIIDRVALEKVVLPAIFKEAKCSSFLRKLYRWGFTRKRGNAPSREEDLYINPLFRSGDSISCEKIRSTRFTTMINPGSNATDPSGMMMHPSHLNSSNGFLGGQATSSSNSTFSSDQFSGQEQCCTARNEYLYQEQNHWASQNGGLYHQQGHEQGHPINESSLDCEQQYRSVEEQLLQHKMLQQQLISQLNGTSPFGNTSVLPPNDLNNEQDSVENHVSLDDIQSYEEEHIKDTS